MTTSRRRGRSGEPRTLLVGGRMVSPPAELLDPSSEVWTDQGKHLAWMAEREFVPMPQDRMGQRASALQRRRRAAESWAHEQRLLRDGRVDWKELAAWGLI